MAKTNRGELHLCLTKCFTNGRVCVPDEIVDLPGASKHFLVLKAEDLEIDIRTTEPLTGSQFLASNDTWTGSGLVHHDPRILLFRTSASRRDYFRVTVTAGAADLEVLTEKAALALYRQLDRKLTAPAGLVNAAL